VITVTAADPEDIPLTYGYSVTGGSLNGSTVTQGTGSNSNVFTVTPHASQDATFTLTFTASDGINQATSANAFSLSFVTIVTDSNHTTLLATATGTSDNNNITDSSSNNHSITVNGDAYAGTFSPYRSGGYSTYFDGNGDYLNITYDATIANWSSTDYTIEAWVNYNSFNVSASDGSPLIIRHGIVGTSTDYWSFGASSTGALYFYYYSGSPVTSCISTATLNLNTWHHIVMSHNNTNNEITLYLDGVSVKTHTVSGTPQYSTGSTIVIGESQGTEHDGHITDLRVTTSEVYSGAFPPLTERLTAVTNTKLLTCHLPYIADGSTNDHSITVNGNVSTKPFSPYDYLEYSATDHGGSVYFDGSSGNYLAMPANADFQFGTGDFTIEMWAKVLATSIDAGRRRIFMQKNAQSASSIFEIIINTDGTIQAYNNADILASTTSFANGSWGHIAFVRDNGTLKVYINGKLENSVSNTTNFSPLSPNPVIGLYPYGGVSKFHGYISDFKITKSVEYTLDFIPPTAPLSSSGAELHIKGTDASIIDKSQGTNIRLYGSITGNSSNVPSGSSFTGTNSIYLDGDGDGSVPSGDHIRLPMETFDPKNRPYTVEFWFKIPSSISNTSDATLFCSWHYSASQRQIMVNTKGSTGQLKGYYSSSGSDYSSLDTSNNVWSYDTWHHFAMVYDPTNGSNGTRTIYIDGSSVSTNTSYTSLHTPDPTIDFVIGSLNAHSGQSWEGYIYDFRIQYKCLYPNNNFTPPSAPLEG